MTALRTPLAVAAAAAVLLAIAPSADTQVVVNRGINPWTGLPYRNVTTRNPWTGRVRTSTTVVDPWTGQRFNTRATYNPWTGRWRWDGSRRRGWW